MSKQTVRVKEATANGRPVGSLQTVNVSGTAATTSALPVGAEFALWSVDGATVRVRFDGTNPTAAVGLQLNDGASGTWSKELWEAARFILKSGSAATVYMQPMG